MKFPSTLTGAIRLTLGFAVALGSMHTAKAATSTPPPPPTQANVCHHVKIDLSLTKAAKHTCFDAQLKLEAQSHTGISPNFGGVAKWCGDNNLTLYIDGNFDNYNYYNGDVLCYSGSCWFHAIWLERYDLVNRH